MDESMGLSRTDRLRRRLRSAFLILTLVAVLVPATADAGFPPGFQETTVISGLFLPTVVRFAPDGRVFVAEKGGRIKVFPSLSVPTPTILVDLSTFVHNAQDKGLLGLALDPRWPTHPYVYALYTYDAAPDGSGPVPLYSDACSGNGCVVTARLSRFEVSPLSTLVGSEQVLIDGGFRWCIQFPSHTIGTLQFGADGALYVGAGDGASFDNVDYGQFAGAGSLPVNPCGDPNPPTDVGVAPASPAVAEGGTLRSLDLLTSGDAVSFDGAILRVDPDTGNALPDNPLYGGSTSQDDRIIAFGLRNPFRFVVRPGTNELWIGDVGWTDHEEINRVVNPTDAVVENFGWPCYEGTLRQPLYDALNIAICESLYTNPQHGSPPGGPTFQYTPPYFTYAHNQEVVAGDGCVWGTQASAQAGAFYTGSSYPAAYQNAFFFFDYARRCIWAMQAGPGGDPDPGAILPFGYEIYPGTVMLEPGPNGDLFRVGIGGGEIRRITYLAPTAVATATPTSGAAPLVVQFSGAGSSTPLGSALTYAWDLDGDGQFDDSTLVAPLVTYDAAASITVRLRVTDVNGASDLDQVAINVSNDPPVPSIATPESGTPWRVGQSIAFSGSALDPQDGPIPASGLHWRVILHHCTGPGDCHEHPVQEFDGVSSGSFVAPDHEVPSYLTLSLRAQDSLGLQAEIQRDIQPETVQISVDSVPSGLGISIGSSTGTTPFVREAIIGSDNFVTAPSPQTLGANAWLWLAWSDNGPQSHSVIAPAGPLSITATFALDGDGDGVPDPADNCPLLANAGQLDLDGDGLGDVCDACPADAANDADGDGQCGNVDNCPLLANADQLDLDVDGVGDVCDACPADAANDADGDSQCGNVDNCPMLANANQLDLDGDGAGDVCDACPADAANDADGDGQCGNVDNCPLLANADQTDTDSDQVGDVCDSLCVGTATQLSGVTPAAVGAGTSVRVLGSGVGPSAFVLLGASSLPLQQLPGENRFVVPAGTPNGTYPVVLVNPDGCRSQENVPLQVAPPGGSCGLFGIEALAALAALRAARRRRNG